MFSKELGNVFFAHNFDANISVDVGTTFIFRNVAADDIDGGARVDQLACNEGRDLLFWKRVR